MKNNKDITRSLNYFNYLTNRTEAHDMANDYIVNIWKHILENCSIYRLYAAAKKDNGGEKRTDLSDLYSV